jgi:3-hydroxyisobutyrate dehydrogenase-like beta-hydroxyacid dehydrogenase
MAKRVGFIGVGLMGHGMAKNLMKHGHSLILMAHRNRKPVEDLLAQGASEASTPKGIAERADIVILCVTGAPQVEAVVYGPEGLLEGLRPGMVLLDCSTGEPALCERVARDLAQLGASYVDSPLARTPIEAEAGKLNTMVGAEESVFADIRPILAAFCENIFHMGAVGAGARTKLIYNLISMGHAALVAEAMCACVATGVDPKGFAKVVSGGAANSGIFQLIVPKLLESGDYTGLRFSVANAAKDLRYYNRMIAEAPIAAVMGPAVHTALVQTMNAGYADGLVGDMVRSQLKLNGLELGK